LNLVTPLSGRHRSFPAFRAIAADLEQKVLSGELPLGTALPSEQELAARFAVSRSTIREAIRLLEQMGLIRRAEGRNRLRISAPRDSDIGSRLKASLILQDTTYEHLWEVMSAFEPACARAAARRATAAELDRIADNIRRTEAALSNARDLVELDIEFHALVAAATGNRALQIGRESVGDLFYPAFIQVMTRLNAGPRLLSAHRRIHEALCAHDAKEAEAWMVRHIGDFQRGLTLANVDLKSPIQAGLREL
jgi:GntR family transcriptional regulator, transcriptional repressor for pyruvate dehydrogenase complex